MMLRNKLKYYILFLLILIFISGYFFIGNGYIISTSGRLYVVNKVSKDITVFDLEKGTEITKIPVGIEPHEITTVTSNKFVVVSNYGNENTIGRTLTVINTKNNLVEKVINLGESAKPHGIVEIPETNKVLVVTNIGNNVLQVNIKSGKIEKIIPTLQKASHLLTLHPNKNIVFVSNISSNSISVIDIDKEKVIKIIKCGNGTYGIDVTPDGKELWITNNRDNTINVINTETYKITYTLLAENQPLSLKITPNGEHCLVTNSLRGSVYVFDVKTKELIHTIQFPGKENMLERILYHTPRPVSILIHPNEKYAFIANSNANRIEIIDLETLTVVSNIKTGEIPDGMVILE